jgi:hypothetical protein
MAFRPSSHPAVHIRDLVSSAVPRSRRRTAALLSAIALLGGGCDIPTSAPNWETRWVVRAEDTSIPVASFLPGGVTETPTEFVISVSGGGIARSLGDLCSACAAVNGTVVPKPAFSTTLQSEVPFPVDLDSLTLTRGTIQVRVTNHFGFDPIRPSAAAGAARGQITITIRNGSTVLGVHTIDGATTAFGPGSTLLETVAFSPDGLPRTIGGTVAFEVAITSPAGDPVAINTSESMSMEAADASIGASSAKVRVQDRTVVAEAMTLDLSGLEADLTDRVQRGSLMLDIENPFAVGGTLTATLSAPGVTLVRPLAVVPGTSQVKLAFTGAELRSLFGPSPVTLAVSGALSAVPAGPVVVQPAQRVTAQGRLELYLTTNGQEEGQ